MGFIFPQESANWYLIGIGGKERKSTYLQCKLRDSRERFIYGGWPFFETVSHRPGWFWTGDVAEDDLKLLIFLSLSVRCWHPGCVPYTLFMCWGLNARQALYQLSYLPRPLTEPDLSKEMGQWGLCWQHCRKGGSSCLHLPSSVGTRCQEIGNGWGPSWARLWAWSAWMEYLFFSRSGTSASVCLFHGAWN